MKELKKPIQPFYMPQMTASYKFVVDNLSEFGIECAPVKVAISQLKAIQKEVDLNKISTLAEKNDEDLKPIWISREGKVLDGTHRVASKRYKEGKNAIIRAIRIDTDDKDGLAYLKIIQDRWEQQQKAKGL